MGLGKSLAGDADLKRMPWYLLLGAMALCAVGVAFVWSAASPELAQKQLFFGAVGCAIFAAVAFFDYRHLAGATLPLYLLSLLALAGLFDALRRGGERRTPLGRSAVLHGPAVGGGQARLRDGPGRLLSVPAPAGQAAGPFPSAGHDGSADGAHRQAARPGDGPAFHARLLRDGVPGRREGAGTGHPRCWGAACWPWASGSPQ